jgi:hypothetical protein
VRFSIGDPPNLRLFWSDTALSFSQSGFAGIVARGVTRCAFTQQIAKRS